MQETLNHLIKEALDEAIILETGRSKFSDENVIHVAQKLSGAPYASIEEEYLKRKYEKVYKCLNQLFPSTILYVP